MKYGKETITEWHFSWITGLRYEALDDFFIVLLFVTVVACWFSTFTVVKKENKK